MATVDKLISHMTFTDESPSAIRQTYLVRTPRSAEAFRAAERYLVGGVTRQAGYWAPYPITIERGAGTELWDVDGHRYLDLINNYTSLIHGHAYPPIMDAVQRTFTQGTAWVGNSNPQLALAELLVVRIPSVERIRFTNSGSEAANLALTVARMVTGRYGFLMVRYGYHGSIIDFSVSLFQLDGPRPYVARFNDTEEFVGVLRDHGSEISAVFLEPVWTAGGIVPGERQFLEQVRDAAHRAGALLVFDEVVTLRLGMGGAQGNLGVAPDLTMLGKIIGGGFPIGAIGGKSEHLAVLDPAAPKAVHSGTFNGNPVSTAAGIVSMRELTAERIDRMEGLGRRLRTGLLAAAERAGLPCRVNQAGSVLCLFLQRDQPESPFTREDRTRIAKFHLAALNHGVLLAPRGMMALSTVMTENTIDEVVERCSAAMQDVAKELPS
jgi:glutamate-1-semialdehyde 2,1-aminomutase